MKTFNRVLAMLLAVLLLCGAMGAFAEVEVELDAPQDFDSPELDIAPEEFELSDDLALDIAPEAFGLSDDLAPVEEEPEAAAVVSNADDKAPKIKETFKVHVGYRTLMLKIISFYRRMNYSCRWTSSDQRIVKVKPGGIILARSPGRCIVTMIATRNRKKASQVVLNFEFIVVDEPLLSASEKTLKVTESFQLQVDYLKGLKVTSWSSSDPKVATVKDGKVVAVGEGKCDISAKLSNDKVLTCKVEVKDEAKLNDTNVRMEVGWQARLVAENTYDRKVSWSCSDPDMVKMMTKGAICVFFALKEGQCTVTATLDGGKKLTCKVTIKKS